MTLTEAIAKAYEESKNGYVVHVQQIGPICYRLTDWYSESVIASYENGRELQQREFSDF